MEGNLPLSIYKQGTCLVQPPKLQPCHPLQPVRARWRARRWDRCLTGRALSHLTGWRAPSIGWCPLHGKDDIQRSTESVVTAKLTLAVLSFNDTLDLTGLSMEASNQWSAFLRC